MLLALDTSTQSIGVALYNEHKVLCESIWTSLNYHTTELAPEVTRLLAKANVEVTDLSALAVAIGPGSFTGLRIGLAFAKGLALAHRLPIVGIPTLDILAASQPLQDIPMAAVLQAGRGRLAVGWYKLINGAWHSNGELELLDINELHGRINKPTRICGELKYEQQRLLKRKHKNTILASPAQSVRRPAVLAEIGWERRQAGSLDAVETLSPIYLHHYTPIPG